MTVAVRAGNIQRLSLKTPEKVAGSGGNSGSVCCSAWGRGDGGTATFSPEGAVRLRVIVVLGRHGDVSQ